jgi:hypothetical protein
MELGVSVELVVSGFMRVPLLKLDGRFRSDRSRNVPLRQGRNVPFWELLVPTPAVFVRVANKGVAGYGTWKKIRKMGDGIEDVGRFEGLQVAGLRAKRKRQIAWDLRGSPRWNFRLTHDYSTKG